MADNVAITAGTGTPIATDEVAVNGGSLAHVQYVKLVDGTANGVNGVPSDVNGLYVEAHRDMKRIAVNSAGLTIATTAYASGDQVGTLMTLADAGRFTGATGMIVGVTLISAADIIGSYDVVIFRSSVTLAADNTAFAISDADALAIVGIAQLTGAFDIGANRIAQAFNLAMPYDTGSDSNLYAALVCRASHTFFGAVTDLQLQVYVERN